MAVQDDWLHGHRPWSPPIVELAGDGVGHLLCWEKHERDGSWYAWVSWVQSTGNPVRHRHHVVSVRAEAVRRLENSDAYARVPRRVLGSDGQIRPWTSAGLKHPTAFECDLATYLARARRQPLMPR